MTRGGAAVGMEVALASLYSSLITRQTGRAVRLSIQEELEDRRRPLVTVLDFRNVSIIDFSCADEVAAKLVGTALEEAGDLYFLFTGVDDHHLDPVESALRRRGLAVAAERTDGSPFLLGDLDGTARRTWRAVCEAGGARPDALAPELGVPADDVRRLLRTLHGRRLLLRRAEEYLSLRRAVTEATSTGP